CALARRLLRQVLRLPRRRSGRALLACRDRRRDQRDIRLLLSAHRQGDVFRRTGGGLRSLAGVVDEPDHRRRRPDDLLLLRLCGTGPQRGAGGGNVAFSRGRMTLPLELSPFYRLVRHERIDSTNEEAKRLATADAPQGTLVWAGEQTAGRGRRGRGWVSPAGNLHISLLLRPNCPPAVACQVNFAAGVALAAALADFLPAGKTASLKWPNDVLVGGAKVSGILLEASAAADGMVDWLVVGVGVNVVQAPRDTPYPASSLHRDGARDV